MDTYTCKDIQPSHHYRHGNNFNNFYAVCRGEAVVKDTGTSGDFELIGTGTSLNYKSFQSGMFVIAKYDNFNTGVEVFKFNHYVIVVDKYKNTERALGIAKNWKEVVKLTNCKTLAEASSKGFDVRMHVTDLAYTEEMVKQYGSDSGDWYYEFEGRFCRGSGAEKLSFVQLITVQEHAVMVEKQIKANEKEALARKISRLINTIEQNKLDLAALQNDMLKYK